jgi:hypothetical protein
MLLTSRSFAEYCAAFDLDPAALPARIVDCAAGASDFVAQAARRGAEAVAADPGYRRENDVAELARAGKRTGKDMIASHRDRFTYAWYGTPEARTEMRDEAIERFATQGIAAERVTVAYEFQRGANQMLRLGRSL